MKNYDKGERYLAEIDHVSILEPIDEVFDSASSLMTDNSVMYGSSVTSVIANLPIVGDLDIAVSNQEYMKLCQNFASSVKWVQVDGSAIPERSAGSRSARLFASSGPTTSPTMKGSRYLDAKHLPISNVVAFKETSGARVQIVESKAMTGDILEDALEVVRKVDFTFCGIAVDKFGRMLEVIPNAHNDCLSRIIRIQDYQPRLDGKRLRARMHKYVKRGWSLGVSIDQALANLRKAKIEYLSDAKKKSKKPRRTNKHIPGFEIRKTVGKGIMVCISPELMHMVGSKTLVRDIVRHNAKRDCGINLNSAIAKDNFIEMFGSDKIYRRRITLDIAYAIARSSLKHLQADRNINIEKLEFEAKRRAYEAKSYASKSEYKYSTDYASNYASDLYITTSSNST